ncbi:MAG: N-acetylgalactosamine-6-sulfatase [Roseibacillus sp.]|jgi:arylsulfatase A-like enzyme|nr:N-acetylgalactosamine-6-sulfatase [Roseibacillus sp.]MBP34184.1 N-acetylgalactosamine-6-sulfatase [Roseibacillus sp.]
MHMLMKICNVILTAWALALATVAGQTVEKPNVIFLMADDLGFGDIGFNGNKLVKTPNLDQMAADGLRFTRFYSVGPVCSPTRACVQTGRHCMRFGMITVNVGKLPKREINLARIAKSKGYDTGHFGKWHLGTMTKDPELSGPAPASTDARYGPPWERHYDETFTTETNVATWDPLDESDLRIPKHRCHFWSNGKEIKEDWKGSSEKIIMGRAIDFMEKSVESGKPFMATVWFYGPHSPTRAGRELRELYPNQPLGRQHYLGSITSIDQEIGRLREALRKLGAEKNTLIFFSSDNGPEGSGNPPAKYNPYQGVWYGGAGEFRGRKRYLYNGGVCVPAFAFWPKGIEAGRTTSTPVCSLDYLPTFASILGYVMPDKRPIDGENILPLLRGKPWQRTKFIPFASQMQKQSPKASIIQGDHKLLLWMDGKKPDELYHLHNDPGEQNNLARQNQKLAASMEKSLKAWLVSARHSYEKGDYPNYDKQGIFIRTNP